MALALISRTWKLDADLKHLYPSKNQSQILCKNESLIQMPSIDCYYIKVTVLKECFLVSMCNRFRWSQTWMSEGSEEHIVTYMCNKCNRYDFTVANELHGAVMQKKVEFIGSCKSVEKSIWCESYACSFVSCLRYK